MNKVVRWGLWTGLGGVALVIVTAGVLIHKEKETLAHLMNPGSLPTSTTVYSRWQDLRSDGGVGWPRVVRWLEVLHYQAVPHEPLQPGQYRMTDSEIEIFTRPFRYPDRDYPAQRLQLHFAGDGIDTIRSVAGQALLQEWRLEPVLLATWRPAGLESRAVLRLAELPPYVPKAILAMEDKRFYGHGAFDLVGIARAFSVNLRTGHLSQGASTISQQLARSIFLDIRRTWRRKILESALALYLEVRYPKPQLLEMYLNQVYWGQDGADSVIGLEAASQSLFGKPARLLTVAESATLAGMLQSPNRYSPRANPQASIDRRKLVLGLMRDQGAITPAEYKAAVAEPLRLVHLKSINEAAYFLAAVHDELTDTYAGESLASQGWTVFTTLDPLLQHEAVRAMANTFPAHLKPKKGADDGAQAGLLVLEPRTGAVLAWVGGTDYRSHPFDHVSAARRQPGSAFKPVVALAALESRQFTTASVLEDKPLTLTGNQGSWTPRNYDLKFRGKVTLWQSLVYSLNVPMVRLAMGVGIHPITEMAHRLGIESPLGEDLSVALGTSEVTLRELTGAYGTLAAQGQRTRSYLVDTLLDQDRHVQQVHASTSVQVAGREAVYLVTQMLEAVLSEGTAKSARLSGLTAPAAGKTGTSENFQDAWFVGYTPEVVCGVWVGFDLPKPLGRAAAGIALPIWTAFMKQAVLLNPSQDFVAPETLVWKSIDPESGMLARSGCPMRKKIAFMSGTEPQKDCPLHAGGILGFFKRLKGR